MRVVIDGIDYSPSSGRPKSDVALAITTRNRHKQLAETLEQIRAFTPPNFPVFVVDDASDPAVSTQMPLEGHRFETNVGIPRAKNKCLELLMATEANHFFLLDDDCWPTRLDWWLPYTLGGEPHYSYVFTHWVNGSPVGDCAEVYNDGVLRGFDQARGCAIYLHRSAVEKVGGFDPVFGLGMEEHLEYSRRINNAGLTTFAFQDVVGSDDLWYSVDRAQAGTRTIPSAVRADLLKRNVPLAEERKNSTDYIEYRTMPNTVVTQLLTKNIDGQRGTKWEPDLRIVGKWAMSIKGADCVVLADEIDPATHPESIAEVIKTEPGWDIPHLQRWVSSLQYVRSHKAQWVWITDGSDVEMLNEPWDHMRPNVLYVGNEPCTIGKPWLALHHPFYADWIAANSTAQMLNCGIVGGDYSTVKEFLSDMVRELTRAYGQIDYEMGSFNYLLRQPKWKGKVEYGPHVTTTFKANERTEAWWKHK